MLLSDVRHATGPECPFKQNRVQKPGPKQVNDKVTHVHHCNNSEMVVPADVTLGYQTKIKWSSQVSEFKGKNRIFDDLVAGALACEAKEEERLTKLDAFHK